MPPAIMDHVGSPVHSINTTMQVMSIAMPVFLSACVGYVLYTVPCYILIGIFHHEFHKKDLAIGLLVPYVVIATLMVASYARLIITIYLNPGIVALGPEVARDFYGASSPKHTKATKGVSCCGGLDPRDSISSNGSVKDLSSIPAGHDSGHDLDLEAGLTAPDSPPILPTVPHGPHGTQGTHGTCSPDPRLDPDSPGLELFYTKDVFECSPDGRPIYCSPCGTWKPDRTHHCSEINRCVRKMDHFCPWVGGIIAETSFKFFLQFIFYATSLCVMTIAIASYTLWHQKHVGRGIDARIAVALSLASFLCVFSSAMSVACVTFVFSNTTTVERYQLKTRSKYMAVRIQRGAPPVEGRYNVVTYPLPKDDDPAQEDQPTDSSDADSSDASSDEEPDPHRAAREARAARRAARDLLAFRTFAIIPVRQGLNVYDLGWRHNWLSVMGSNVLDWMTPFRLSPCCNHESTESAYPLSDEFKKLLANLNLPPCRDLEDVRQL